MTSKIEISYKSVFLILVTLVAIWLVVEIKDILFLLFIAFIVMSALRPIVNYLERRRIPKILSILIIYITIIGIITASVSSIVPPLVSQTSRLIENFPKYLEIIKPYYHVDTQSLTQQITPIGENVIRFTVGLFSNIITFLTILVFTFYLLLEHNHLEKYLREMFSKELGDKVVIIINSVEYSLGAWLRGELILMFFIGLLSYIGLTVLQVDYALPLAIIAGLLEIVPVIGPIISGIPAVLVAITVSPILALSTIALYFIVHQLENHLIVPLVMKKAVDLSPLVTIIALMIGTRLSGITGAILAIPIVVMVRCIIIALVNRESKA